MDPLSTGLLIVLMVASFYLLIIRPNKRRKTEQARLHDALKPGARVMLSSGIYATVVQVGERQAVVTVAPGVELTVLKQAVLQAVTPGSQFAEDTDGDHEAIDPAAEPRTGAEPGPAEEPPAADSQRYVAEEPADPRAQTPGEFGVSPEPDQGSAEPVQPGEQGSERDRGSSPSDGGEKR